MSGRPGTLLSGGEFPILVPQGLGQTAIEFRQFGVSIEAVAVVLGDGRVRLDISPEVSDLDFTNGVTLDGIRIPGLTTRRVNTQAEMKFGETLVLGGLISKRRIGSTSKVPFLGELPVIGAAFSRKRYEDAETELLIMVTPMPAAPFQPGEQLPRVPGESSSDPTDKELYLNGQLELPRYGERCRGGQCNPAAGGLITPMGPTSMPMNAPVMNSEPMIVVPPEHHQGPASINVPSLEGPTYPSGEPYSPSPTLEQVVEPISDGLAPGGSASIKTLTPRMETPQAKTPVFEQLEVKQVSFQKNEAVAKPEAVEAKPSRMRIRFNPFNMNRGADRLNAPRASGPVSRQSVAHRSNESVASTDPSN